VTRSARRWLGILTVLNSSCGGAAPMLHPAHTLPQSEMTMGAGTSGTFVMGDAASAIDAGEAAYDSQTLVGAEQEASYAEGLGAALSLAPGVAPWVGARVGLGLESEAGITYTGRSARVDARHALEQESFALSAGMGVTGVLLRPDARPFPGVLAGATQGWGLDVPVLAGWRSSGSVAQLWGGIRGGFEQLAGKVDVDLGAGSTTQSAELDLVRWQAGWVAGLGLGLDPVRVMLEVQLAHHWVAGSVAYAATGSASEHPVAIAGWSLAPAAAVVASF